MNSAMANASTLTTAPFLRMNNGFQFVTTALGLSFKACRFDLAYLIPAGSSTSSTMSNTFKI